MAFRCFLLFLDSSSIFLKTIQKHSEPTIPGEMLQPEAPICQAIKHWAALGGTIYGSLRISANVVDVTLTLTLNNINITQ